MSQSRRGSRFAVVIAPTADMDTALEQPANLLWRSGTARGQSGRAALPSDHPLRMDLRGVVLISLSKLFSVDWGLK
jgi:hypothetical protein